MKVIGWVDVLPEAGLTDVGARTTGGPPASVQVPTVAEVDEPPFSDALALTYFDPVKALWNVKPRLMVSTCPVPDIDELDASSLHEEFCREPEPGRVAGPR